MAQQSIKKIHPRHQSRRVLRVLAGLCFVGLAIAAACTSLTKLKKNPVAKLESVEMTAPDAEGATLVFGVAVENPNEVAIEADSVDYALEIEGKPVGSGAIKEKTSVPALGKGLIKVPVRVRYVDLFASVLDLLRGGSRNYRVVGSASFGWVRIPFEKKGEIQLPGPK